MSEHRSGAELEAEDFLELVYGSRAGWIDLPAKVEGYWVPWHYEWEHEANGAITRRIDSSLRDGEDLYYSVTQFSSRGRRYEDVLPSSWLWADLDEVDPQRAGELGYLPTVAVQSSPGRYQALWRLSAELSPRALEKLNRALTYALDADKGGWDLTQVLRIPGTRNFKYEGAPFVQLLWYNPELVYDARAMWRDLKELLPPGDIEKATHGVSSVVLPRRPIPRRAKQLLRAKASEVVEGERSSRLWELECLLAEAGLTEEEIFDLVWPCRWNKWAGVGGGRRRLLGDVKKAVGHVRRRAAERTHERSETVDRSDVGAEVNGEGVQQDDEEGDGESAAQRLPWISAGTFVAMDIRQPRWMVEEIWGTAAQGFIAGEPKTSKSLLSLAFAVAVASGEPFLGEFRVKRPGPVLLIDNETGKWATQDRLRRIEWQMGLLDRGDVVVRGEEEGGGITVTFPEDRDLPLKILSDWPFNLGVEEHRDMLVAEIEEYSPSLLILDPFYLMLGDINENQTGELRPILSWLSAIRAGMGCSVAINHHFSKLSEAKRGARQGQRMSGNWALHGWASNLLYCTALKDERERWSRVRVDREFRFAGPRPPLEVAWVMPEDDDTTEMEWEVDRSVTREKKKLEKGEKLGMIVRARGKEGMTISDLADESSMSRDAVRRHVEQSPFLNYIAKTRPRRVRFVPNPDANPAS